VEKFAEVGKSELEKIKKKHAQKIRSTVHRTGDLIITRNIARQSLACSPRSIAVTTLLRWSPFCRRAVVACIHSLFGVVIVDKTLTLSSSICTYIIQLAPRPTSHTTVFFYSTSLKHLSHTLSISSLLPLSSIPSSTLAPYMHKLYIGLRTYRPITSRAAARRRFTIGWFSPGSALIDSELPTLTLTPQTLSE